MNIRCDSCSVSLQLDEDKVPAGNFTVRCPRCQNMIRVTGAAKSEISPTVQQLERSAPAPAVPDNAQEFSSKESEFQINNALRSLLTALNSEQQVKSVTDDDEIKPRRVLLCLGANEPAVSKVLLGAGFKVYVAETPAQANERLREGKTEIVIYSPDFGAEFGGGTILQQKINKMHPAERRRIFLVSLEDGGATLNAHDAFLRNLNLIVNTTDVNQLPMILSRALRDYNDLYHYFNKAAGVGAI
ncbi:MAG: zinc-ribbon domain-containing protein [Pyrinomonadaceae bacterium]|nr:zinc-ribbon domain-containing protein [Pyrinomonadaceae bacterium]